MKRLIILALLLVSTCPGIFSQIIGISAGYGSLSMNMVNNELDKAENFFYDLGLVTIPSEKASGGFFFEGNFKYGIGICNFGIEGNYIASTGSFFYKDNIGSFEQIFDVSTEEYMALIEIVYSPENFVIQPFFQAAGGVGFASVSYSASVISYSDPSYSYAVDGTLKGTYFSGRFKGGLQFVIENIILETAVGYRIADAGILIGDFVQDNNHYNGLPLQNENGQSLEFDFSGFLVTGGISFRF